MTDVRLTATNPDDSTVVPVACNAKGELKLEEPIAPPGFDGNLDGDLAVTGSAAFENNGNDVVFRSITSSADRRFAVIGNDSETKFEFARYGTNNSSFTLNCIGAQGDAADAYPVFSVVKGVGPNVTITQGGAATFVKDVSCAAHVGTQENGSYRTFHGRQKSGDRYTSTIELFANGTASFAGDVVVGSRSKQWMLVEQSGLCHMIEQTRELVSTADLVEPQQEYPKLRDVINELDLVEQALQAVMERLRMDPPAGWPVWDGSA